MREQGDRVSVRWTEDRTDKIEDLGWQSLSDGEIIDKALDIAKDSR